MKLHQPVAELVVNRVVLGHKLAKIGNIEAHVFTMTVAVVGCAGDIVVGGGDGEVHRPSGGSSGAVVFGGWGVVVEAYVVGVACGATGGGTSCARASAIAVWESSLSPDASILTVRAEFRLGFDG